MNFEKALDENFDGFIAKGNNNFIEIILNGQGKFCFITVQYKVGYVFLMVDVAILPHVEFGRNDHREDAPHFIL